MANQPETATYDAGVFQLETGTAVLGGVGGAANAPLLSLANRTAYLKEHIDLLEAGTTVPPGIAVLASPAFTGVPTAPTAALGTNTTQIATMAAVLAAINDLINGAPGALDTIQELAASLGNDPNFATTVINGLATKLALAGGEMTGFITLHAAPTANLHAATKAYADLKLALTGGTLTNFLTLHADPTSALHAATKQYVDATVITQIVSGYRALKIVSADGGTSSVITCDAVTLEGPAGAGKRFEAVNKTLNLANSGAGGLDTDTVVAATWYHVWIIGKPDGTVDVLGSLSSTAPTMPSGFTLKFYAGEVRTKSGSAVLIGTIQYGNAGYFIATPLSKMVSGSSGNVSTGPRTAVAVAAYVPPTASHIIGNLNGGGGITLAAPNNTYGAYNSTTNVAPVKDETDSGTQFCFVLEGAWPAPNIYYASSGDARAGLYAAGWISNKL
jgi:hypothetical protein